MAEVIGEAFLSAFFQVVLEKLASSGIIDHIRRNKIEDELVNKLDSINQVLDEAEKKQYQSRSVKEWLHDVKHAIYEADQLLDEIATDAPKSKKEDDSQPATSMVRSLFSSFTNPFESRIKDLLKDLEILAKKKEMLELKEATCASNKAKSVSGEFCLRIEEGDKLQDISKRTRYIWCSPELKVSDKILEHIYAAKANLKGKKHLEELQLEYGASFMRSRSTSREMDDSIIERHVLEADYTCELRLEGCDNILLHELPSNLKNVFISGTHAIESSLKNILFNSTFLEVLNVRDFYGLNLKCSSFDLRSCSSLRTFDIRDWYPSIWPSTLHLFTNLHSLVLFSCPQLESFPEGGLPLSLSNLEIRRCPKLIASRQHWDLFKLHALKEFTVSDDFRNVESFPEERNFEGCFVFDSLPYARLESDLKTAPYIYIRHSSGFNVSRWCRFTNFPSSLSNLVRHQQLDSKVRRLQRLHVVEGIVHECQWARSDSRLSMSVNGFDQYVFESETHYGVVRRRNSWPEAH
ncbi:hypothetical protein VNO77_26811 [Canavalia gladiata]|uniref:Disease resistance N-terminal domain-containing protein n=1 Tax=Canavalia gladiata TaxID=3824 RepID=A0AAN9KU86_CANGL